MVRQNINRNSEIGRIKLFCDQKDLRRQSLFLEVVLLKLGEKDPVVFLPV